MIRIRNTFYEVSCAEWPDNISAFRLNATLKKIAEGLNLSSKTVRDKIAELVNGGYIIKNGTNKHFSLVITK